MKWKLTLAALFASAMLSAAPATAGDVTVFESQILAAYADYRAALFQTNRNDRDASMGAMSKFTASWTALSGKWLKSPPPHYVDDTKFVQTLQTVSDTAARATAKIAAGELAAGHEVLEEIRDQLADLRARNGISIFSDRMNAYHTAMEHVLGAPYDGYSATGLLTLREDVAVLAYLTARIAERPPAEAVAGEDFAKGLAALKASVAKVQDAARAGDATAAREAVKQLKQPYAMLFLKFG